MEIVGILVEVIDTESGVLVLFKELGPTNNVDIELMAKEMDYSSVKMMLLIMSGLEKNPGPGRTNLSSHIYYASNLKSAKKFFDGFISDREGKVFN